MKNLFIVVLLLFTITFMTGCATIGASAAGNAAGKAVYLGYTQVAEKQSPEFNEKIEELWKEINTLESIDDLVNEVDRLTEKFNEVLSIKTLTPEQKALLESLENLVMGEVKKVMASKISSQTEAIEFLVAFRKSVNGMIARSKKNE